MYGSVVSIFIRRLVGIPGFPWVDFAATSSNCVVIVNC